MNRWWRYALIAVVVVVSVDLLVALLDAVAGGPTGPALSAFSTSPEGVAAYADLLKDYGHPVEEKTSAPFEKVDPSTTLVVLDATELPLDQIAELRTFVSSGGTLVAGGEDIEPWLGSVVGGALDWNLAAQGSAHALLNVPETAGVSRIETGGFAAWSHTGDALPVVGSSPEMATVAVRSLGAGRVVALADASFLENRYLDRADNAALGLAIAGPGGRPVAFVETVHGYGTGLGAIPYRWRWALAIAGVGVLLLLIATGRRLGPPEISDDDPLPPRRVYIDALAAAMARSKHAPRPSKGLR
ncbi:MAG: DUF4350 domain-containing protein [Actinomycetota bacterium]